MKKDYFLLIILIIGIIVIAVLIPILQKPETGKGNGPFNNSLDKNCSIDFDCKTICALGECYNKQSYIINDCYLGEKPSECACIDNQCTNLFTVKGIALPSKGGIIINKTQVFIDSFSEIDNYTNKIVEVIGVLHLNMCEEQQFEDSDIERQCFDGPYLTNIRQIKIIDQAI